MDKSEIYKINNVYIIYSSQNHTSNRINDTHIKTENIVGIYKELKETIYNFKKIYNTLNTYYYKSGVLYILNIPINKYVTGMSSYPSKIIDVNKYVLYMNYWRDNSIGSKLQKNLIVDSNTPKKYYNYLKNLDGKSNNKSNNKSKIDKDIKIDKNKTEDNERTTYYVVNSYIKPINNKYQGFIDEYDDKYSRYIIVAVCDNIEDSEKIYEKYKYELAKNIPEGIHKFFDYYLRIDIINGGDFLKPNYASKRYQENSINIKTDALFELKVEIYTIFQYLENDGILCNDVINIILDYFDL